jgi:thioredoxin 1
MINLTSDNFAETVFTTNSNKLTMIQFSAGWCDSCREFQNTTLPQLKTLYPNNDVIFCKIDVDHDSELADKYNVDKLPTFLFFKERTIINFIIGNESIGRFKRVINDALNC